MPFYLLLFLFIYCKLIVPETLFVFTTVNRFESYLLLYVYILWHKIVISQHSNNSTGIARV